MEIEQDNFLDELVIDSIKNSKDIIEEAKGKHIETLIIDFADEKVKISDIQTLGTILQAPAQVEKINGYFFACFLNDAILQNFLNSISHFQNLKELELELGENSLTSQGFINILQLSMALTSLVNLKIDFHSNNLINQDFQTMLNGYKHNSLKHLSLNFEDSNIRLQSLFAMTNYFISVENLPELRIVEIHAPNVSIRDTDFDTWFMLANDTNVKKV